MCGVRKGLAARSLKESVTIKGVETSRKTRDASKSQRKTGSAKPIARYKRKRNAIREKNRASKTLQSSVTSRKTLERVAASPQNL
jgi:hypothetical protein